MARNTTYGQGKLYIAKSILDEYSLDINKRLSFLEAVAAHYSGADIEKYWKMSNLICEKPLESKIHELKNAIEESNVPYYYAISILSREDITVNKQKKNGVFYTDYRLAEFLSNDCVPYLRKNSTVVDLAAGTGILLVGVAEKYKNIFPDMFNSWIEENLYAYDLSYNAIRGAAAALLSLTNNERCICNMQHNWNVCDSLSYDYKKRKFDIIIGNPPWGKIKLLKHYFVSELGVNHTYGHGYNDFDEDDYKDSKLSLKRYSDLLKRKYSVLDGAEVDIYMAFLQLAISQLKEGGHLSFLVPAGVIRSKGTYNIREYIISIASYLEYVIFDNKKRYFNIDTRFKFLSISLEKKNNNESLKDFYISFANKIQDNNQITDKVNISIEELRKHRPDLTVPEVHNQKELDLFFRIYNNGRLWGNTEDEWKANISREIDMTNDRDSFMKMQENDNIPVIEGRMVQQYRFGAKAYVSGCGRSAVWEPSTSGCIPQFYYNLKDIKSKNRNRIHISRVGFCDIAGQTNERAMMSTIIPEGVICGNKVPTIVFQNGDAESLSYLWVAISNSFVFDWMIRRIISTTINFFILFSIPIPKIDTKSDIAKRIICNTKKLLSFDKEYYKDDIMGDIRAEIEVEIALLYGLDLEDMKIVLSDFPLLDRGQAPINNEEKSTVSKDYIMYHFCKAIGKDCRFYKERVICERSIKSKPFIPSEMSILSIA